MTKEKIKFNVLLGWQAKEHEHLGQDIDWVWTIGIIGVAATTASLIIKNYLFALLIIFITIAVIIKGIKKPKIIDAKLTNIGIVLENELFPYENIKSFYIKNDPDRSLLVIRTSALLSPVIQVPLEDIDPDDIREILAEYLPEVLFHKSLADRTIEWIGF